MVVLCSSSNILTSLLTMSLFLFGPTMENTLLFMLPRPAWLIWVMPIMYLIHRLHSASWIALLLKNKEELQATYAGICCYTVEPAQHEIAQSHISVRATKDRVADHVGNTKPSSFRVDKFWQLIKDPPRLLSRPLFPDVDQSVGLNKDIRGYLPASPRLLGLYHPQFWNRSHWQILQVTIF